MFGQEPSCRLQQPLSQEWSWITWPCIYEALLGGRTRTKLQLLQPSCSSNEDDYGSPGFLLWFGHPIRKQGNMIEGDSLLLTDTAMKLGTLRIHSGLES